MPRAYFCSLPLASDAPHFLSMCSFFQLLISSSVSQTMVFILTIIVIEVLWHRCEVAQRHGHCFWGGHALLVSVSCSLCKPQLKSRFFHGAVSKNHPLLTCSSESLWNLSHFSFIWQLTRCYLVTSLLSLAGILIQIMNHYFSPLCSLFSNKIWIP